MAQNEYGWEIEHISRQEYVLKALAGDVVPRSHVVDGWQIRWEGMIAWYDEGGYPPSASHYIWRGKTWRSLHIDEDV